MPLPPRNANSPAVGADDRAEEPPRYRPDPLLHWTLLGVSSAVILSAVLLQVRGDEQVFLPGIGLPLPGTCTFKQFVGADCPGCGLTRCFVSMGHGQLQQAWHFHPVGIVFFAIVASQIPFRTMQLWRLKRGANEIHLGWWSYSLLLLVLAALLIQWIVRLFLTLRGGGW